MIEPLCRSFGSDLGHARDIVRRIADKREVVDNLLWQHIEFCFDAIAVQDAVVHRVHEGHVVVDELCEILVAGRNQDVEILRGSLAAQSTDDIVGFDTLDL